VINKSYVVYRLIFIFSVHSASVVYVYQSIPLLLMMMLLMSDHGQLFLHCTAWQFVAPSFSISVCVCVCLWVLHLEDILLRYGINSTHLHSVRLFDLPLSRAQSFVDRTLWLWLAQPWHTLYVCYWVSVCAPHTHTHTHTHAHPRSCCICHRL